MSPAVNSLRTAENLWRACKDHHYLDADLQSHGKFDAVELQILWDGILLLEQRYDRRELATAEAHALLQHYRAGGWTVQTQTGALRRPGVIPQVRSL